MKQQIVNLKDLVSTVVNEDVDVQETHTAKQEVLDAVADAQAISDGLDANVAGKLVEISDHTTTKIGELDSASAAEQTEIIATGDAKMAEYDLNAEDRLQEYDDNHTNKLGLYNANDATKISEYNYNHTERLDDLNFAYADRIVDMIKTRNFMGIMDEYVAQTETHMIPFLSTDDENYMYYGNGTLLEPGVDYTVYDSTRIELAVKANPYDVIVQVNTQVLNDILTAEYILSEDRIGQPNGIAGLDSNGLVPTTQLPSYVDDVIEVGTYVDLPVTGESGKVYVVIADETSGGNTSSYRWTGSIYAMVSNTLNAADVKALYESNADTNEFTDAEKTKLVTVENRANHTGTQAISTVTGLQTELDKHILNNYGISSGCEFTVNAGDPNKYDVSAGEYWIDDTKYTFAGEVGRDSVGLGGSFSHVRLEADGIHDGANEFIDFEMAKTALEVATYAKTDDITIEPQVGDSRDLVAEAMKNLFLRMKYFKETEFKNGAGKVSASSTNLRLDMSGGTVSAPNTALVDIPAQIGIACKVNYTVAGIEGIQGLQSPFTVDATKYDDGTNLVNIIDNPTNSGMFVTHTLARSMRSGFNYFIYGHSLYSNLGEAQSAVPDLGVFRDTQEGSFVEPLALVIIKEGVNAIYDIVDVRGNKEANTIDSIVGKTISGMVSGNTLVFNGNQIVAETPATNAGQGVSLFLGNNIIDGDNYDLSIFPAGGVEVEVQQTANSGDGPKFIERYVSDSIGGSSIDAGAWRVNTYASVDASPGLTEITTRINRAITKTGTITSTGTGLTRTFTASEAGTFVASDADTSILNATLIQTPTETFWIDSFISDTQVTATTDGVGYVNETGVVFDMYYKLFEVSTGEINESTPALFSVTTVQPQFTVNPEDRILAAYFMSTTSGNNKTVSLYKNGSENYSHIITPLIYRHNSLSGLNEGDYQHLSETEHITLTGGLDANGLHHHDSAYYSKVDGLTADGVSVSANGNLSSGTVQSALEELQTEIDIINNGEW